VSQLEVELVDSDEIVWTGAARMVRARSTEGELGIMPDHTPLLAILTEGEVVVQGVEGQAFTAAVDGGFLSVDRNQVRIVVDRVTSRSA
jgi:F-type H+-transporting ATPase subunit epsilon